MQTESEFQGPNFASVFLMEIRNNSGEVTRVTLALPQG